MFEASLALYFIIYLWKHAKITAFIRKPVFDFYDNQEGWLADKAEYLMKCAFCISFWSLLAGYYLGVISNPSWIFTIPILCLFYDLIYVRLTSEFY